MSLSLKMSHIFIIKYIILIIFLVKNIKFTYYLLIYLSYTKNYYNLQFSPLSLLILVSFLMFSLS